MFNYFGEVVERLSGISLDGQTKFDIYSISIPAIASEPVTASVLTIPGSFVQYSAGDVVVVAEVESVDGPDFIILGLQQLSLSSSKVRENVPKKSIALLYADDANISAGTISQNTRLITDINPSTSSSRNISILELVNRVLEQERLINTLQNTVQTLDRELVALRTLLLLSPAT